MRLIDADLLREDILNDNTFDNDTVNYYLAMVDGMETAYDVNKVVKQLKKHWCEDCRKQEMCNHCSIKEFVLDIVKGAVKDE